MGVRAIRLVEGDRVVGMARVREGGQLLTVSEKGAGRRTNLEEYRLQFRGGKGIRNYHTENKDTLVAAIRVVDEDDDVILISDDGVIIRIPVEQITVQSRYGGGVRAMRVAEDARVVSVARAPKETEEDAEEETEGGEPAPEQESVETTPEEVAEEEK